MILGMPLLRTQSAECLRTQLGWPCFCRISDSLTFPGAKAGKLGLAMPRSASSGAHPLRSKKCTRLVEEFEIIGTSGSAVTGFGV